MIKLRVISKKLAVLVMGTVLLLQMPAQQFLVKAESMPEGNWTLLPEASDEFNGNELDAEKWNNGIWYDVSTDLAFKKDNVSIRDGKLILTAKKIIMASHIRQVLWNPNSKCRAPILMWK